MGRGFIRMLLLGVGMVTGWWLYVELMMIKKTYTASNDVSKAARQNNCWLAGVTVFCFTCLYASLYPHWFEREFPLLVWLGGVIAISGITFRHVAIKTLEEHFDGLIQVKEAQRLIQHGLYRYLRHPSYTGTMITFFGFGLMSMNYVYALLFPMLFFACYYVRIQLEEQVLLKGFGEEYANYQQHTWGLLPWIKREKRNVKEKSL